MDIGRKTKDLVNLLNTSNYDKGPDRKQTLNDMCLVFDSYSKQELGDNDYAFLKEISSNIGIPQYFKLLVSKKGREETAFNLSDVVSSVKDSALQTSDSTFPLHKYQKEILDSFEEGKQNRFFLSAPTSFGKTFLTYEIIKKRRYKKIVLIFPTIALISENLTRLSDMKIGEESDFWSNFTLHTLPEEKADETDSIFIFTPERFITYMDVNPQAKFDFAFMDEVYKIDNAFLTESGELEDERDVAFRTALSKVCFSSNDILLSGPYITFPKQGSNNSIQCFISDNHFQVLNYNDCEIVFQRVDVIKEKKHYDIDGKAIDITSKDKIKCFEKVIKSIIEMDETAIVYRATQYGAEKSAKSMCELQQNFTPDDSLSNFIQHLENRFGKDWIVAKALRKGIGIHHGMVPKYIQNEIIRLFNRNKLKFITSTTTITEGVNTIAKNMVVFDDKKGDKSLKHFDAMNIAGRAGRFTKHFTGNVFIIQNDFYNKYLNEDDCLRHKNYDITRKKNDVDLEYTPVKYLSEEEKKEKAEIEKLAQESGIPSVILNQHPTISKKDKINMFNSLSELNRKDIEEIDKTLKAIEYYDGANWCYSAGFSTICKLISNIPSNSDLQWLLAFNEERGYANVSPLLFHYITEGFEGILNFKKSAKKKTTDSAVRDTARLVYSTFRYRLTKYLAVLDSMYRYYICKNVEKMDSVLGFHTLITLLECGFKSEKAKKANDYGVPFSVLKYLETEDKTMVEKFDDYEKNALSDIEKYLEK